MLANKTLIIHKLLCNEVNLIENKTTDHTLNAIKQNAKTIPIRYFILCLVKCVMLPYGTT